MFILLSGKGVIHKPEPERKEPRFTTKDKSRLGTEYDLVLSDGEDSKSYKKKKRKRDRNDVSLRSKYICLYLRKIPR